MLHNQKLKPQTFNDGLVKIYEIKNTAAPGDVPNKMPILKGALRFDEKTVGIKRYYEALQSNIKITRLVRCPAKNITTEDIAVINDAQYEIVQIQNPPDVTPKVMDLSLSKLVTDYAID